MNGIYCPNCGGDMEEIDDGIQCFTCYYIVRSDGSIDTSEMEDIDD